MKQKLINYFVSAFLFLTFYFMFLAVYMDTKKAAASIFDPIFQGFLLATFMTIVFYLTYKRRTAPTTVKFVVPDSSCFLHEVTELMLEEGFVPIHTIDQNHYFIKQGFFDSEVSQLSQLDEGEFKIKGPNHLITKLNKNLAVYNSLEISRILSTT